MRNFKLLDILKESREFGEFLDQYEKIWDRRSARQQARRVPGVSRQGTGATPTLGISRQDLGGPQGVQRLRQSNRPEAELDKLIATPGRLNSMGVLLSDRMAMGGEGWLADPDGYWVKRFHRDTKASAAYPRVFIDDGRGMPNGEPALLKRRCHIRREEAEKIWKNLRKQGWKQISPVWGEDVDP